MWDIVRRQHRDHHGVPECCPCYPSPEDRLKWFWPGEPHRVASQTSSTKSTLYIMYIYIYIYYIIYIWGVSKHGAPWGADTSKKHHVIPLVIAVNWSSSSSSSSSRSHIVDKIKIIQTGPVKCQCLYSVLVNGTMPMFAHEHLTLFVVQTRLNTKIQMSQEHMPTLRSCIELLVIISSIYIYMYIYMHVCIDIICIYSIYIYVIKCIYHI